jgi:hypothetical protein
VLETKEKEIRKLSELNVEYERLVRKLEVKIESIKSSSKIQYVPVPVNNG